jgi:hypothetical protein
MSKVLRSESIVRMHAIDGKVTRYNHIIYTYKYKRKMSYFDLK